MSETNSKLAEIAAFLAEIDDGGDAHNLGRLDPLQVIELRSQFPDAPEEYLEYLEQIGAGSINDCRYMVYDGLLDPSEIFHLDDVASIKEEVLLFGDDFSGNPAGFLPRRSWRIVEIIHDSLELIEDDRTFVDFIRQKIGMDD